jgi:hypothetical protein
LKYLDQWLEEICKKGLIQIKEYEDDAEIGSEEIEHYKKIAKSMTKHKRNDDSDESYEPLQ